MYTVYIILSGKTGKYYTGYTGNVAQRLTQHNRGENISTRNGAPWTIVYKENHKTRQEAWLREHEIKSYKGGVAFKKLVE